MGRTAANLQFLARWALTGAVALGALSWWTPGYQVWGALTASLLAVWVLWLMERLVRGDTTIPAHPLHLALAGPAAILTCHAAVAAATTGDDLSALSGALDASMVTHLALTALGVMLAQGLLPRSARHAAVLSVSGAAMMLGAVLAAWLRLPEAARAGVALVGYAGVGVWLAPLWPAAGEDRAASHPLAGGRGRAAYFAVATAVAVGLALISPLAAMVAMGTLACVLLLSAIIFPGRRVGRLLLAGGLATVTAAALASWPWRLGLAALKPGLFGRGEEAFTQLSAGDSGLAVLAGTSGWIGLGWLTICAAAGAVYLLARARRGVGADRDRAVVWTTASALAAAALLAPGGFFLPSTTVAVALTWGLLPSMLGRPVRPRGGWWFLFALIPVFLLTALTPHGGLAGWVGPAMGGSDFVVHCIGGAVLALAILWLLVRRSWWVMLAAWAVAVLLGGAGELMQRLFSERNVELSDWIAHAIGCAVAGLVVLLCLLSRWCESPDARPVHPRGWQP